MEAGLYELEDDVRADITSLRAGARANSSDMQIVSEQNRTSYSSWSSRGAFSAAEVRTHAASYGDGPIGRRDGCHRKSSVLFCAVLLCCADGCVGERSAPARAARSDARARSRAREWESARRSTAHYVRPPTRTVHAGRPAACVCARAGRGRSYRYPILAA